MRGKKSKILMLLSNAFNPDPRVHREAKALVDDGYHVTILCWDRDVKELPFEEIHGIRVQRVYVRSTHGRGTAQIFFLFIFWLKALLRALGQSVDIVHAHDFDTLPLGYVIAKLKGAKLVYDAHESYVDMLHELPITIKRCVFHAENFLLRRIDLLVTVGELLQEYFIKRGAIHTCLVGNWQDPQNFLFDKETLLAERKRLGISSQQIVIVFIANLGRERQLPPLIEAVKDDPGIFLLLGGHGPCGKMAEDAAVLWNNIGYLGYVHPSKIPLFTALSDMVYYGFDPLNPNARFSAPNKLFEALAAGKPVLTGNFGEIGRIVKKRACGAILSDYSAISIMDALRALNDDRMTILSINAKEAGKFYNWKKARKVLIASYRSMR